MNAPRRLEVFAEDVANGSQHVNVSALECAASSFVPGLVHPSVVTFTFYLPNAMIHYTVPVEVAVTLHRTLGRAISALAAAGDPVAKLPAPEATP